MTIERMTDNERISKWRGECRHNNTDYSNHMVAGGYRKCLDCGRVADGNYECACFYDDVISYDSDPAAWTPELYKAIEDAELDIAYIFELGAVLKIFISEPTRLNARGIWLCHIATPAQKASALARVLEEQ